MKEDLLTKNIQLANESNLTRYTEIVEKKIRLSYNLERLSNLLIAISIVSGFIAIFSNIWIGIISLTCALIASLLLVYKFKSNLNNDIDIYLWLAERSRVLYQSCSQLQNNLNDNVSYQSLSESLNSIIEDHDAHLSNISTESLTNYYELRYNRNMYSAALKNKRNRHEIKDLN